MKKGLFFLLLAGILFSGCAEKNDITQNPKDFKTTDEVLGSLNNLNNGVDDISTNKAQKTKTNTYIIKSPTKASSLRTPPKIMETLFLGYVDEKDNRVSDYFVNTVIDNGEWVGKNSTRKNQKKLGGLNE
jgi:outer membrane lipoprotein-sorting protein